MAVSLSARRAECRARRGVMRRIALSHGLDQVPALLLDVPEHRRRRGREAARRSCARRRLSTTGRDGCASRPRSRAPARPRRSPSAWPDRSRARNRRAASPARASHGQPNAALSQLALTKPAITGLRMSADTHEVSIACQPPALAGSFLTRRATTRLPVHRLHVDLEAAPFPCSDFATGARLVSTCRSVECSSTIGVPS